VKLHVIDKLIPLSSSAPAPTPKVVRISFTDHAATDSFSSNDEPDPMTRRTRVARHINEIRFHSDPAQARSKKSESLAKLQPPQASNPAGNRRKCREFVSESGVNGPRRSETQREGRGFGLELSKPSRKPPWPMTARPSVSVAQTPRPISSSCRHWSQW